MRHRHLRAGSTRPRQLQLVRRVALDRASCASAAGGVELLNFLRPERAIVDAQVISGRIRIGGTKCRGACIVEGKPACWKCSGFWLSVYIILHRAMRETG
jgi:hypothetical protein